MSTIREQRAAAERAPVPPAPPALGGELREMVTYGYLGFLVLMAAASLYNPRYLTLAIAAGMLLCAGVVMLRFPIASSVVWLLIAGTSPEWWLADMTNPGYAGTITAAVKMAGLLLVGVCMLRYGAHWDAFNPGFAFAVMFVIGLTHPPYRDATFLDSVRSLIGAVAPFAFSFSRPSKRWCNAIISATIWVPLVIVLFGVLLQAGGVRPLMTNEGRLEASTHPAFLGGFAAAAIYATLLELYRDGKRSHLVALAINFVILFLSGARAPLACALEMAVATFFLLRSTAFPAGRRVPVLLVGAMLVPLLVAAVATLHGASSLRLLNMFATESNAADLSGRDILWVFFKRAWQQAPLFGWGVGASKFVIPPDSLIAHLLGTTAPHNEYLRIGVDGGYFGLGLLIAMMALWATKWTLRVNWTERFVMRLFFVVFAIHSITDNTLIAATASVLFTWVSAVFARAAIERREAAATSGRLEPTPTRRASAPDRGRTLPPGAPEPA